MKQILLDRNENQYGPAPGCYTVLQRANLEQLSLYSRDYLFKRKSELSFRLSQQMEIPEERILLSYGSEDMLKQVVHCYLDGSRTMLLPRQSWWYYKALAAEVHGKQVEYSLHEEKERFVYDVQQMIDLYKQHKPQLILVASPNNPTGSSIGQSDLSALIERCPDAVIVLDQAYVGFTPGQGNDLQSLLGSHERLVVLRTFSKYYALAGLRIGYACVGTGLSHLVKFSARYLGYNQLTERIALAAMDEPEYYESITRRMSDDKEMYFREFSSLSGFTPFRSDANFILVRYPAAMKNRLKTELERRGVVVKFLDDPGLEDCVRITIGTTEQNNHVMSCFRDIVAAAGVPLHAA